MTDSPTPRTQIEALLQQALDENDDSSSEQSEQRITTLVDVLAVLAPQVSAECEHEWVMRMIDMPGGQEKPGSTSCRKCGEAGAEVIVSGTTEIKSLNILTPEDLAVARLSPPPDPDWVPED